MAEATAEEADDAAAVDAADAIPVAVTAAATAEALAEAARAAAVTAAAAAAAAGATAATEAAQAAVAVDAVVCDICLQPVRFSANLIQHQLRYHAEHVGSHRAAPGGDVGVLPSPAALEPRHGTPASTAENAAGRIGGGPVDDEHDMRGGDAGAASVADATGDPSDEGDNALAVEGGDDETLSHVRQGATGTPALVHEYYKAFGDLERTQPVVPPERGGRPSLFVTDELKSMRMFALSAGGSGLSAKARTEFYNTTVLAERAAMRTQRAAAAAVRAVVERETPSDDSSDDDSGAIDPPDVATGVNQSVGGPCTSTENTSRAASASHLGRPERRKRRPKNNRQALQAAMAMLVASARPDDAARFASLVSDDTGATGVAQCAPADPTASTLGADPALGGGPSDKRPRGDTDGQARQNGGAASKRGCNKRLSKRKRDIIALKEALDMLESTDGPVESAFPKASAFLSALDGEANRCLHEQKWRKTEIKSGSATYLFYSRDVMIVALDAFTKATSLCLRGKRRFAADNSVLRTDSLNGDLYMTEQESIDKIHANKTVGGKLLAVFTLAIQLFSDATLVSWNNGMSIANHFAVLVLGVGLQPVLLVASLLPDTVTDYFLWCGGPPVAGSQHGLSINLPVFSMNMIFFLIPCDTR